MSCLTAISPTKGKRSEPQHGIVCVRADDNGLPKYVDTALSIYLCGCLSLIWPSTHGDVKKQREEKKRIANYLWLTTSQVDETS